MPLRQKHFLPMPKESRLLLHCVLVWVLLVQGEIVVKMNEYTLSKQYKFCIFSLLFMNSMFIVSLLGCLYTHLYSFALLTPTLVEVLNLNSIQVREMMSLTILEWKTSRLNLKLISFSFSPYFINHYTYISSDDYTNLPPLSPNRHPLRRSSQPSPRRNTRLRLPRHQRGSPSFLQGR